MTNGEKIDLLNTLPVVNSECDGEICLNVMVEVNLLTRKVLNLLGHDDKYIDANIGDDNEIDISHIGWTLADWWEEDRGFCLKEDGL